VAVLAAGDTVDAVAPGTIPDGVPGAGEGLVGPEAVEPLPRKLPNRPSRTTSVPRNAIATRPAVRARERDAPVSLSSIGQA
jgi:hypothetical protein